MSEPIKVEAAQAEIPGTAPKADETKTAAAEPAPTAESTPAAEPTDAAAELAVEGERQIDA